MRFVIGLVTGILLTLLVPVLLIAAGAVNMGAIGGPGALETVFASWAFERWRQTSAPEQVPTAPPTTEAWTAGLEHYSRSCAVCHGAPGVAPAGFARHLSPRPPDLAVSTRRLTEQELYLIIHDGVRMTGMPAFGRLLSEEDIAHLVRFIRDIEHISPEQQQQMMQASRSTPLLDLQAPDDTLPLDLLPQSLPTSADPPPTRADAPEPES